MDSLVPACTVIYFGSQKLCFLFCFQISILLVCAKYNGSSMWRTLRAHAWMIWIMKSLDKVRFFNSPSTELPRSMATWITPQSRRWLSSNSSSIAGWAQPFCSSTLATTTTTEPLNSRPAPVLFIPRHSVPDAARAQRVRGESASQPRAGPSRISSLPNVPATCTQYIPSSPSLISHSAVHIPDDCNVTQGHGHSLIPLFSNQHYLTCLLFQT